MRSSPRKRQPSARDEHVVLYADAAEVLVFFDGVEVEEILVDALRAPQVDEIRYEVDTRLVRNDKAFLQPSGETQARRGRTARRDVPRCRSRRRVCPRPSMSCTSMPIMWPSPWGMKRACAPAATAASVSPFIRPRALSRSVIRRQTSMCTSHHFTPGRATLSAKSWQSQTMSYISRWRASNLPLTGVVRVWSEQ